MASQAVGRGNGLEGEQFRQLEELFHATCGMDSRARREYLRRECPNDALRREAFQLLECDAKDGDAFDDTHLPQSVDSVARRTARIQRILAIEIGTVLGDYCLEEEIGRGGMAVVFRACQISLDRAVAVKVMTIPLSTEAVRERFRREAAAGARLQHRNIVSVFQYGEQDGVHFYAMEYIEGPTLDQWLNGQRDGKSLDEEEHRRSPSDSSSSPHQLVARWTADAADGLAHAHAKGVIHRDIKPSNLILDHDGNVKILDLGVARLSGQPAMTMTGVVLGTPRYMSPEQISPERIEVDHRTDIYSLGATMYELLTLRPPMSGEDYSHLVSEIRESTPPRPRSVDRRIPVPLETICLKAMEKDPRDRYQTAQEMLDDLRNYLAGRAISASRRNPILLVYESIARRKYRLRAVLAAAALVFATTLIGVIWLRDAPPIKLSEPNRITSSVGYTADPTLSGDGRWVAYVSDHQTDGDVNIWLQELQGVRRRETPLQITNSPGNEIEPALSANGKMVAYSTTGADGGLYLLTIDPQMRPSQPRLISEGGRSAKFSPNDSEIAYWVGPSSRQLGIIGDSIWIAPVRDNGPPRQLCEGFVAASFPVWSPDGQDILFKGISAIVGPNAAREAIVDWWVVPRQGGAPKALNIVPALVDTVHWPGACAPGCWTVQPEGGFLTRRCDRILFAAFLHKQLKLWSLRLTERLEIAEKPEELSSGGSDDAFPGTDSAGRLCCFADVEYDFGVWSLPIDANAGERLGDLVCCAENPEDDIHPSVSANGKRLVFASTRFREYDIFYQVEDETPERLTPEGTEEGYPVISQDGTCVVYTQVDRPTFFGTSETLRLVHLTDRKARRIQQDVGVPINWHPAIPPRYVLTEKGGGLNLVDTQQRTAEAILSRPGWNVWFGRFSPDGRWIAFSAARIGNLRHSQIFVAPYRLGEKVSESDWMAITDGSGNDHAPDWSPNGRRLYYMSDRDGFRCVWSQLLEAETKQASSPAEHVYHCGRYRQSPAFVGWPTFRLSVAKNRLVFSSADCRRADVWVGKLEIQSR